MRQFRYQTKEDNPHSIHSVILARIGGVASFRKFLAEAGLNVEDMVATPVPLLLVVPNQYHGWWLRPLHWLNAMLAKRWKTMFGYQFVAVARRARIS